MTWRIEWWAGLAAMALVGGCSPGKAGTNSQSQDDDFTCAALISAADMMVNSGNLPANLMTKDEALMGGMTRLNSWALPKNMREADAFAAVKQERDRLIGSVPTAEIGQRARACLDSGKANAF